LTSDFAAGITAILNGSEPEFTWNHEGATLGVVLASEGYPDHVIKGAIIPDIPDGEGLHTYYAGVANSHVGMVSSSGRVLLVEATRPTLQEAQDSVYGLLDELPTEGLFYRHDIGAKALN
jgi:phosphoribosylamine--glycine ligase